MQFYDTVNGVKDQAQDKINDAKDRVDTTLENLKNLKNLRNLKRGQTFHQIRVGYHSLCIETSNGWGCASSADQLLSTQEISQDPLHLVSLAGIYTDKIVWSVPLWITISSTAVAYILVITNAIRQQNPSWVSKIAAGALALATISTLAAMVVSRIISSSVSTIMGTVTMNVVEVHLGRMIQVFGWVVFALGLALFIISC